MKALVYGWSGWEISTAQSRKALEEQAERGLYAFKYDGDINPGWFRVSKTDGQWTTERVNSYGSSQEFDDLYNTISNNHTT